MRKFATAAKSPIPPSVPKYRSAAIGGNMGSDLPFAAIHTKVG